MARSYAESVETMRAEHMDYPAVVGLETLAACNARCSFCDYPRSHRKGQRISEMLFDRFVNEIAALPRRTIVVNLSGTSEPLMDQAIFERYARLERAHAGVASVLYTNGSLLTPERIDKLVTVRRWRRISVSLNAVVSDEYERTMKLKFEYVAAGLDRLHCAVLAGRLRSDIVLTRVSSGPGDDEFSRYCGERWSLFTSKIRPLAPSISESQLPRCAASTEPCSQWFKIHFLPDGREKLCCVDTHGEHARGMSLEDASMLTIYNAPWRRRLRQSVIRLGSHPACTVCSRRV